MALGAFTVDNEIGRKGGPLSMARLTVVGDTSYPTGGTVGFAALVAAALGITGIVVEAVVHQGPVTADFLITYDKANDKLTARVASTGVEVANAVNMSGTTFELLVIGK